MYVIVILIKFTVSLGLLNVWLVRANQATGYRGQDSKTLKEEFLAYGLPIWMFYFVGTLKVVSALAIFVGIFWPGLATVGASLIALLMLGALVMHLKVHDPLIKSLPAGIMLLLSIVVVLASVGL
ncbi:MAG: DoxX family protein [Lentimonas sp.]